MSGHAAVLGTFLTRVFLETLDHDIGQNPGVVSLHAMAENLTTGRKPAVPSTGASCLERAGANGLKLDIARLPKRARTDSKSSVPCE